ncbi:MAG: hypothetical protein KGI06_01205 [Candidatus Micrarchaeota archaeon]|nr:hypothetical protein [Candidatus Micrarchaeota archaeon]
METAEHCKRCGTVVYAFSKNAAVSDNSSYCIKCAEELDSSYLARNTCSVCTRLLAKDEVKFVMPSRLYSAYFFDRLPMEHRLMCVTCYRKADRLNILKRPLVKIEQVRTRLRRTLARKSALRIKE